MLKIRNNPAYQQQIMDCAEASVEWSLLQNKVILITGATGMIGVFLIDVLMERNKKYNDNIRIVALSRDEDKIKQRLGIYLKNQSITFLKHDVNQPITRDILPVEIDYIIHGASNTHPLQYTLDPVGTIEANVTGTRNLLELTALMPHCRMVFLSSVEVYGENRGDTEEFAESYCGYIDCNTLRACYTEGKRLGEALCQAYIATRGIDAVIPRLCRVYGPTMLPTDTKAISQLIKKAVTGENIVLKSEGKQLYSYLYVADVVTAILTLLLKGETGQAYNVADRSSNSSLKELAQYLANLNGRKVVYELPDDLESRGYSTATKALLNPDKLKALGWNSRYALGEGLELTYEILREDRSMD